MLSDLQEIGTFIVTEITKELAKKDKKASGKLLKSINSKVEANTSGYEIAVYALSYFKFIDKGVQGAKSSYVANRNSPYRFKSKKPPLEPLLAWVKQRALSTGDRSAMSAAFAIQTHIWKNGIEGINFLDEFLKAGLNNSLGKLADTFVKDISVKIDKVI